MHNYHLPLSGNNDWHPFREDIIPLKIIPNDLGASSYNNFQFSIARSLLKILLEGSIFANDKQNKEDPTYPYIVSYLLG